MQEPGGVIKNVINPFMTEAVEEEEVLFLTTFFKRDIYQKYFYYRCYD